MNLKKGFSLLGLIICLMVLILPSMALIKGFTSPSIEHINRAKELVPDSSLIQIGMSSGSYSCENGNCDFSNYFDQKQYVTTPNFNTLITVKKPHEGDWVVWAQDFDTNLKIKLLIVFLGALIGVVFCSRILIKSV